MNIPKEDVKNINCVTKNYSDFRQKKHHITGSGKVQMIASNDVETSPLASSHFRIPHQKHFYGHPQSPKYLKLLKPVASNKQCATYA